MSARPTSRQTGVSAIRLAALACIATAVVGTATLVIVVRTNHGVPGLLSAGRATDGSDIVARDFPHYRVPPPLAGPAQSAYVIAREPLHLTEVARHLDRPRYRLQAILFPLLAWSVHPTGAGRGLVIAMWIIAAAGVALSACAAALLADTLGASARAVQCLAVLVPVLPASVGTLALTTPDALGLGFALAAMTCDARRRRGLACVLAVLAVLTQPATGVVLVGWTIWRGRQALVSMLAVPALVGAAWAAVLEAKFASTHDSLQEFSPLLGLERSMRAWATGDDRVAALTFTVATLIGLGALAIRGIHSPLAPSVGLQFVLIATLAATSLAGDWNAVRATGPLLALGVTALAVPGATRARAREERR